MGGTPKGSAALYTEIGDLIAPNGSGEITASILAGVLNDIVASYPNTTDGLGGYSSIGTITDGLWNGTSIGLGYGGTNASLSASLGGILYSTASAAAILAGTATAGQMLQSGADAAPSWTTTTWPATTGVNELLWSISANQIVGLATANGGMLCTSASGVPSVTATPALGLTGTQGKLILNGSTSGSVTLGTPAIAGTGTIWNFPPNNGNAGSIPTSDGSGNVSWTVASYPGTVAVNSLLYASGANTVSALATANGGILNTSITGVPSITQTPTLGLPGTISGKVTLLGLTAGSVGLTVPAIAGTGTNFSLPNSNGTSGFVLQTDGSGNTSWVSPATIATIGPYPQGRLTLESSVPVMVSGVSAASSVIYTPYLGSVVPLWNGSVFVPTYVAEISNVLANSTTGNAGPAAAVASSVYDLFVWSNSGTPTLTRGPAWTNATTRSAGAALGRVKGLLTNSVAITNGPGANAGTYVGTVITDSSGATVTWGLGGATSGGIAATLNVWNMYNRVIVSAIVTDNGSPYAYSTATTRQARASSGNQVSLVAGSQEDYAVAAYVVPIQTAAAQGSQGIIGIGLNTTTAFSSPPGIFQASASYATDASLTTAYTVQVGIGVSTFSGNERGDGTTSVGFDSSATATLTVTYRM